MTRIQSICYVIGYRTQSQLCSLFESKTHDIQRIEGIYVHFTSKAKKRSNTQTQTEVDSTLRTETQNEKLYRLLSSLPVLRNSLDFFFFFLTPITQNAYFSFIKLKTYLWGICGYNLLLYPTSCTQRSNSHF